MSQYNHFDAQIEQLDRAGYLKFAAEPHYFNEQLRRVKLARPKVQHVRGVGHHAVEQVIFLPHGVRSLVSQWRHELKYADRTARNTRRALRKLGITA